MLKHGPALLCLLLLLTACAATPSRPALVSTETIEVATPTPVAVDAAMTTAPPMPELPAGELSNEDLIEHIESLRTYGCGLIVMLGKVADVHGDGARPVPSQCAEPLGFVSRAK